MSSRRHRDISAEEAELWQAFTRDVVPLRRQPTKLWPLVPPDNLEPELAIKPKSIQARPVNRMMSVSPPLAPTTARGSTPGVDAGTARRFHQGALAIDARLDLHGLTQDEAHTALSIFVQQAYGKGKRCLLIITGKGKGKGEGILKRNLPRWLSEPQFRPLILALGQARAQHGGDGAYYVLLKRRRESR